MFGPICCEQCGVESTICRTFQGISNDHEPCILAGARAAHKRTVDELQPWNDAVRAKEEDQDTTLLATYKNPPKRGCRKRQPKTKVEKVDNGLARALLETLQYKEDPNTGCWKVVSSFMPTAVHLSEARDGYARTRTPALGVQTTQIMRLQMQTHASKVSIYTSR